MVKVFVPDDKCQTIDKDIELYLNSSSALIRTPSGHNDDMFVIEAAMNNNGVIVSNDHFRAEQERTNRMELRNFIEMNRLPFVIVDDVFIPASDPRGKGPLRPSLDEFLCHAMIAKNSRNNNMFGKQRKFATVPKFQTQAIVNRSYMASLQPNQIHSLMNQHQDNQSLPGQSMTPDREQKPFRYRPVKVVNKIL